MRKLLQKICVNYLKKTEYFETSVSVNRDFVVNLKGYIPKNKWAHVTRTIDFHINDSGEERVEDKLYVDGACVKEDKH